MSLSLRREQSCLFVYGCESNLVITGHPQPNILHQMFLSNTSRAFVSELNSVYIETPAFRVLSHERVLCY